MSIRLLDAADAPVYKSLRDCCLAANEEAFTTDAAQARSKDAAHYRSRLGADADGNFTLGALDGDGLVGAVSLERDARVKVRHIGHIVGMMVLPEMRGQGIGRQLMDALLTRARADESLLQLTLSVTASNEAATFLYRSAGFELYGTLPQAICWQGRYHDKALMRLRLAR